VFGQIALFGMGSMSYDYPFVCFGTIMIFMLLNYSEIHLNDLTYNVIQTSTGIWILHPFVLKILEVAVIKVFGSITIGMRCVSVFATVSFCIVITLVSKKIKWTKYLLSV